MLGRTEKESESEEESAMDVREDITQPQSVDESFRGSVDSARPDLSVAQAASAVTAQVAALQEMPTLVQNTPGVVVTLANLPLDLDLSNVVSASMTGLDIQDPGTETVDMATPYIVGVAATSTGVVVPLPSEQQVIYPTPATADAAATSGPEGDSQQAAQVVSEKKGDSADSDL